MWCSMCMCADPITEPPYEGDSRAFADICTLVVDTIQSSLPVDDHTWDRIHDLTRQISPYERQQISYEMHNATLSTALGTHIEAWSVLSPTTFYQRLVDNGRWIDSIDAVDSNRADAQGTWRVSLDPPAITSEETLNFSNYRLSRRASDRSMYNECIPLLKKRFPSICWEDVPSTPHSVWRSIHVERDLGTYEMQRAFMYATRDVACFRARHTMDLKRDFTISHTRDK